MSDPGALVDTAAEALEQLDGFGPWHVVGAQKYARHALAGDGAHAVAYIEVAITGGDWVSVHLVAERLAEPDRPVFDAGAAADRAHEARIDQQNEVD